MKCKNCGGEMGLLDKVCPYCGSENEESAGHQAKFQFYKRKSRETVETADQKYSSNKPLIAGSVILVLLIIGVITMTFIADKTEFIDLEIAHSETLKEADRFKEILNGYLEAGDYISFYNFVKRHHIYETDPEYKEYALLLDMASNYRSAMDSIEQLLMYGEGYTYDKLYDIKDVSRSVSFFYVMYGYAEDDLEEDPYKKYAEDMKNKLNTAMRIYFGLDEKGLEDYLASSENQQTLFIQEAVSGEKD